LEEAVGIITLHRPDRLNAINGNLLRGLMSCLETARSDSSARSVVLTGAGTSFCAGEDLKETSAGKSMETWEEEIERLQDIQRAILRLGKPLVAAVRGYALGGGLEFALGCDVRIAATDARFGFPETGVGLTLTGAGTKLITQIVGLGKAKELIFSGEIIDAAEAHRIGMVNRVVEPSLLEAETLRFCGKINENSPLSLRLSRTALDLGMHLSFDEILEVEAAHLFACVAAGNQEAWVREKLDRMRRKDG
jgi:enoyl-CoA hydratase/carnithine racemase